MPSLGLDRDDLLRASLHDGALAFIGPERVWIDITAPSAADGVGAGAARYMAVEVAEQLAVAVTRSGTLQVTLGCRADPLDHPHLPRVIEAFAGKGLSTSLQSSLRSGGCEVLQQVLALPLARFILRLNGSVVELDGASLELLRDLRPRPPLRVDWWARGPADPAEDERGQDLARWALRHGVEELRVGLDPRVPATPSSRAAVRALLERLSPAILLVDPAAQGGFAPCSPERLTGSRAGIYLPQLPQGLFSWASDRGALVCRRGQSGRGLEVVSGRPNVLRVQLEERICDLCDALERCIFNGHYSWAELVGLEIVIGEKVRRLLHDLEREPGRGFSLLPFAVAWLDHTGALWLDPASSEALTEPWPDCRDEREADRAWRARWNGEAMQQARADAAGSRTALLNPCDQLEELDEHLHRLRGEACGRAARSNDLLARRRHLLDEQGLWLAAAIRGEELLCAERRAAAERAWRQQTELSAGARRLGRFGTLITKHQRERRQREASLERLQRRLAQATPICAEPRAARGARPWPMEARGAPRRSRLPGSGLLERLERVSAVVRRAAAPLARVKLPGVRREPDVALVMPPLWDVRKPPLNLAQLAEYLVVSGLRVQVCDLNIAVYQAARGLEEERLWLPETDPCGAPEAASERVGRRFGGLVERAVEELLRSGAPVVGFSVTAGNRPIAERMAQLIHSADPGRLVVFGGPEVRYLVERDELDRQGVALFVHDEGEQTLLELVRRARAGSSLLGIPGTLPGPALGRAAAAAGALTPRAPLLDLDLLPFPTYLDTPPERYTSTEMPFLLSRGCPGQCAFCSDHVIGGPFRCRSGEHAVAELAYHVERYDAWFFNFNDLVCNGDVARLGRMCELILEKKLELSWCSYAMVRREMEPELLQLLSRAGCVGLHFGLETGSERVLRLMRKPFSVDDVVSLLRHTKGAGIRTALNLMVGFPGETAADFEQTLRFIRLHHDLIDEVLNLSIMGMNVGSEVATNELGHGIRWQPDGSWRDEAGNGAADRRQRAEAVYALLEELQIPLRQFNRPMIEEQPDWHGQRAAGPTV